MPRIQITMFILFIACSASAAGELWGVSQHTFQRYSNSDSVDYLNQLYKVIARREQASLQSSNCSFAGHVDLGVNKCLRPKSDCAYNKFECAAYFGVKGCQPFVPYQSTTKSCFDRVEDKTSLARLLKSEAAQSVWSDLHLLVNDFCRSKPDLKECKYLKPPASHKVSSWFSLLLPRAHAEGENCRYDDKSKMFHGRNGKKVFIDFQAHGIPAEVGRYRDSVVNSNNVKPAATKLLDSHKSGQAKLESTYQELSKRYKKNPPAWVGLEQDSKNMELLGGTKYRFERMKNERNRLKKAGLSEKEIHDALLITEGTDMVAWYDSVGGKLPQSKAIGVDDFRDDRVDELQEKETKALDRRFSHDFKEFKTHENGEGDTARSDVYQIMDATAGNESERSRRMSDYEKTDDFKTLPESSQKWVRNYRDSIDEFEGVKKERAEKFEQEFKARDQGLGRSIWSNMENGEGSVVLGSRHREGTLASLKRECEKNTPPSEYSHPSSTRSKGVSQ